ncbi:MAG: hypothetical protein IKS53_09130 [Bacteroidales bacterium]|nr:hypothetical protein [Bacteroidales bacterium]
MSFFIAFFPFDFECAKVQHFIGMAMYFGTFFNQKTQNIINQWFANEIVERFLQVKTFLHLNKINK